MALPVWLLRARAKHLHSHPAVSSWTEGWLEFSSQLTVLVGCDPTHQGSTLARAGRSWIWDCAIPTVLFDGGCYEAAPSFRERLFCKRVGVESK